jgi:hypothetical protein
MIYTWINQLNNKFDGPGPHVSDDMASTCHQLDIFFEHVRKYEKNEVIDTI